MAQIRLSCPHCRWHSPPADAWLSPTPGTAKAKAEGKYKGRASTVARQGGDIRAAIAAGGKPAHVARRLGIARSGVYRMLEGREAV